MDCSTSLASCSAFDTDIDPIVKDQQKISQTEGNFGGDLSEGIIFGGDIESACIGDLDGDGIMDLAIGAPQKLSRARSGSVWISFLNIDGTVQTQQQITDGVGGIPSLTLDEDDYFGSSVSAFKDLDGDNIPDIAVGSPRNNENGGNAGAIWILFLDTDGTVDSFQKIAGGVGGLPIGTIVAGDMFGRSLSVIGDLDGDGISDMIVGAPEDDTAADNDGAVYILFMQTDGTVKNHKKIYRGFNGFDVFFTSNERKFGFSVSDLGDLDGDGVLDVAIGHGQTSSNFGSMWILFLNMDGTVKAEQKILNGVGGLASSTNSNGDMFGMSIENMGDLNADGITDIAVGAPGDDDGGSATGSIHILFLGMNGFVQSQRKISQTVGGFTGPLDTNDVFGSSIANMFDLNGDGITDIAVGATGDDDGGSNKGAVWILFLNATQFCGVETSPGKSIIIQNSSTTQCTMHSDCSNLCVCASDTTALQCQ